MPLLHQLAYACGSPGFQLSDRIVVGILIYYYLPPGDSELMPQISEDVMFAGVTAFGAAMLVARIFDSLADPVVGFLSDRSLSRIGRRRLFMLIGILPMCLLPVVAFWPPAAPGSLLNWIYLSTILSLYFIFFTVYVAPYLALLPEMARSEQDRVRLATLCGVLSMPIAGAIGFAWPMGLDWGTAHGYSASNAIRGVVVIASLLGFALSAMPILFVDERRFARSSPSGLPLRRALSETLRNRPFLIYLLAQILFIFGLNLLQPAMPYIAQVMLGRSAGFSAQLGGSLFLGIIVGFLGIHRLAAAIGLKQGMLVCVLLFGIGVGSLSLLSADVPGGPNDLRNLVVAFSGMALAGIPIAGFVILPQALLGQIIDADERRTGANRAAIYFGMQGLMTKWVYGVATATLAFLMARYGNSQAEPMGVWLVAPLAGTACLASACLYALYPQQQVLEAARLPE